MTFPILYRIHFPKHFFPAFTVCDCFCFCAKRLRLRDKFITNLCFVFDKYRLWPIVYRLSSIVYRLSSIVYRLSSIVYRLSSIVYRLSSIVYRRSSIVYRLPSTVYCLGFSTHPCILIDMQSNETENRGNPRIPK